MIIKANGRGPYLRLFLTAFCICFAVMLPLIIYNKGIFLYYGDFNAQQLPFGTLLQRVIKEDGIGWSWGTDLGTSLIGSYSFYLIGSPFFWFAMLFPVGSYVYLVPWLLAAKFGVAAVFAYAYIRRFTRTENAAFTGALLYAFSGFQLYNVFFNHFHDVTALFPLMLIALEERMVNNRRGVFALSVALMAVVNYFFFTGQAVFLIIYFILRSLSGDFRTTPRRFFAVLLEAVLGTGIAAFMLLPSAAMLLGNYRITEYLSGYDLIAYNDKLRLFRIIQGFFMLPDMPAHPNLFNHDSAKWSSIAGYLPLFSMAGVLGFMRSRRKHWTGRLLIICGIMAAVPLLNSAFYMFNGSYYARWYYMPILIMAMMTAVAVDDEKIEMRGGLKVCFGFLAFFAAVFFLPVKENDEWHMFRISSVPVFFWAELALTLVMTIIAWRLCADRTARAHNTDKIKKYTVACCFVSTVALLSYGIANGVYPKPYINRAVNGGENIGLERDEFYRIDSCDGTDNYAMYWDYSTIRTFHSTVSPSIMNFYNTIGVQRDVASRPATERYGLRGLLSVKYYFQQPEPENSSSSEASTTNKDDVSQMPGFVYYDTRNGFDIYINEYFVPMGFTYDYYVTEEYAQTRSKSMLDRLMVAAVLLTDEQIEEYSDILRAAPADVTTKLSKDYYLENCTERAEKTCTDFKTSSDGFTAEFSSDTDELVFFSVPYDKGFTAYVNGEETKIEKVNYGFMAIRVPAGENTEIEFVYKTYGLSAGMIISLICAALLALYLLLCRRFVKGEAKHGVSKDYSRSSDIELHETYLEYLEDYKGKNNGGGEDAS